MDKPGDRAKLRPRLSSSQMICSHTSHIRFPVLRTGRCDALEVGPPTPIHPVSRRLHHPQCTEAREVNMDTVRQERRVVYDRSLGLWNSGALGLLKSCYLAFLFRGNSYGGPSTLSDNFVQ